MVFVKINDFFEYGSLPSRYADFYRTNADSCRSTTGATRPKGWTNKLIRGDNKPPELSACISDPIKKSALNMPKKALSLLSFAHGSIWFQPCGQFL